MRSSATHPHCVLSLLFISGLFVAIIVVVTVIISPSAVVVVVISQLSALNAS